MPQLIVTRRTLISANKMHVLINRIRNTFLLARRAIVRVERYRFHNRRHMLTPPFAGFVDNFLRGRTDSPPPKTSRHFKYYHAWSLPGARSTPAPCTCAAPAHTRNHPRLPPHRVKHLGHGGTPPSGVVCALEGTSLRRPGPRKKPEFLRQTLPPPRPRERAPGPAPAPARAGRRLGARAAPRSGRPTPGV